MAERSARYSSRRALSLVVAAVLPAGVACHVGQAPPERASASASRADSAAPIVKNPHPAASNGARWRVVDELTIGVVEGPRPYVFDRIGAVDVDRRGTIYLLDTGNHTIRVFDSSGTFLRSFGSKGRGPAEFIGGQLMFGGMTLLGDSAVAVYDNGQEKLAVFDAGGTLRATARIETGERPSGHVRHVRDLGGGRLLFHAKRWYGTGRFEDDRGQEVLLAVAMDGSIVDTLTQWSPDHEIVKQLSRSMLEVFPKPFAPRWHWAVAPDGRIALGYGDEYKVAVFSAAWEPVARMRYAVEARRVTKEDVEAFRRAFPLLNFSRGEMPGLGPGAAQVARDILSELEYPKSWPFFNQLAYDTEGRLWVRRPAGRNDVVVQWDVFQHNLQYLGTADVPRGPTVLKIAADRIYARAVDELGVHYLKVYRLERSRTD